MSYNTSALVKIILARLRRNGRTTLSELACELNVSRRTLYAAVHSELHISYRDLQRRYLINQMRGAFGDCKPRSIKELADLLGFGSARSLERFSSRAFGMTATGANTAAPAHESRSQTRKIA